MILWRFLSALLMLSPLACTSSRDVPRPDDGARWDGVVTVHGELRAMMHEGRTAAAVALDTILPHPGRFAVGALADFSGEVTVLDGMAYLSRPDGDSTRTDARTDSAGAALLVSADVPRWQTVTLDRAIPFAQLDAEIARLGAAAGMPADGRYPFLVEGEFEDLRFHVVDGRRFTGRETTHEEHRSVSVQIAHARATATLIGFFSRQDHGVFTHMGSDTHVHVVVTPPLATGHVDHVVIAAGSRVKFPSMGRSEAKPS
jgi:hypothetical protein